MSTIKPRIALYKPPLFYTDREAGAFIKWPCKEIIPLEELNKWVHPHGCLIILPPDIFMHSLFWMRFGDREIDFEIERWDCVNGFTDTSYMTDTTQEERWQIVEMLKNIHCL